MDPTEVAIGGVPILLLTVALVQLVKSRFSEITSQGLPFVALGIALTLSLLAYAAQVWAPVREIGSAVVTGIVVGLSAMGLWSGGKAASGQ